MQRSIGLGIVVLLIATMACGPAAAHDTSDATGSAHHPKFAELQTSDDARGEKSTAPTTPTSTPERPVFVLIYFGDLITPTISIAVTGTYRLTAENRSDLPFAIDVYPMAGEARPVLSISAQHEGTYTVADELEAGDYYANVTATGGWFFKIEHESASVVTDPGAPTEAQLLARVETYEGLSREHTEDPVDYDQVPPVGGQHSRVVQNCGFYDEPVGNEHAVHSLEHGTVWITYDPALSDRDIAVLRTLVVGHDHILVSPFPGLPAPVVASAWGVQLRLDGVDDPYLAAFVAYYEEGPQNLEPGALCSGGTSATLD